MQDLPEAELRPIDHVALGHAAGDPALSVGGRTLDYGALEARIAALAGGLAARGLMPGDRVACWLPKTPAACLLPLAAPRAGLVHVPVNPLLKRAQVAHILSDSGASLLITTAERAALLESADVPDGCAVIEEGGLAPGTPLPPSGADPDCLAHLLYTSGSTGRAKGVMLSHANLWLAAISVRTFLRLDRGTKTLCVLPLAFDYGQSQLLSTWSAGGHAIALDYALPGQLVAAVERTGANTLAGVPSLWAQLADARWTGSTAAGLRCLTNSGGHLPVPLVRRLRGLFPGASLHLMYGLTEAFRASALDPMRVDEVPDAVGTPIPFAHLAVLRPDGTEASPDTLGELVQGGPLVAQGYWRDPERTAARFRPAPEAIGGGMAVWSGDTVVRGSDGLLRVLGRADELIKVSGHRISPTEIEEAAMASGIVTEAVAIGLPEATRGAAIRLVVRGSGEDERLRRHLADILPGFMQPTTIDWVTTMPLTPNGKVDRVALRDGLSA